MTVNEYEPSKKTLGDLVHATGRSLLGAIPFAGQAAIEVFTSVIKAPFDKRNHEWQCTIGAGLQALERQRPQLAEELLTNEVFIDTLVHATQVAIGNNQQEKRNALRNAVLNSALPHAPDQSRQAIFVHFIDVLSSRHLRILKVLDDPDKWFAHHERTKPRVRPKELWPLIAAAYPDMESEEMLCERICRELNEKGLLIASSLRKDVSRFPYFPDKSRELQSGYRFVDELPTDNMVSYAGSPTVYRNWTTDLGRQFLAFITAPPEVT